MTTIKIHPCRGKIPYPSFSIGYATLGTNLVIEFVTKKDPMVERLLRTRRNVYADYEPELFERWLSEMFHVARREPLASGTRTLFYATTRS